MVVYNDNNPYAVEWLRNLSAARLIEPGEVYGTDIRELDPEVVRGTRQYHAFAGIGVWSHALRLAGWPTAVPVWTGSCPCQPFSQAGRKRGVEDDRHLWPAWYELIVECRPPVIFGDDCDWLQCRDGKARPVRPGAFPLAHGVAGRLAVRRATGSTQEEHWYNRRGALEAIGNAIVPQVAAIFIRAFMDTIGL